MGDKNQYSGDYTENNQVEQPQPAPKRPKKKKMSTLHLNISLMV